MPFCPGCGLRLADVEDGAGTAVADTPPPRELAQGERASSIVAGSADRGVGFGVGFGLGIPPLAIVVVLVLAGLFVLGLLPRLLPSSTPLGASPSGVAASGPPAAPIVGLTIVSPLDGQTVATKDVVVIGTAPPGLSITRDVSFGLDDHTTADGTGHWAMKVGLSAGDNNLKFRIGDDKSTEKVVRVIYTPPSSS